MYNNAEIGTIDYTATVGAPIQVDTNATVTAPKMTSTIANDISVLVPLTGVEYITRIDISKITAEGNTITTEEVPLSITAASITKDGRCTVNNDRLSVPVTATCGTMGVKLAPTSLGGEPAEPEHNIGKIRVTIQPEALTVKEGSGWYVPDKNLTYDAVVWGCSPAVTITPQGASSGDNTQVRVTVRIEYAERNTYNGTIAFTTSRANASVDNDNSVIRVDLDPKYIKTDPQGSGQNLLVYDIDNVQLAAGIQYYIWCTFEEWSEGWQNVGNIATGGGQSTL